MAFSRMFSMKGEEQRTRAECEGLVELSGFTYFALCVYVSGGIQPSPPISCGRNTEEGHLLMVAPNTPASMPVGIQGPMGCARRPKCPSGNGSMGSASCKSISCRVTVIRGRVLHKMLRPLKRCSPSNE